MSLAKHEHNREVLLHDPRIVDILTTLVAMVTLSPSDDATPLSPSESALLQQQRRTTVIVEAPKVTTVSGGHAIEAAMETLSQAAQNSSTAEKTTESKVNSSLKCWFARCADGSTEIGPLSLVELLSLFCHGEINANTLVECRDINVVRRSKPRRFGSVRQLRFLTAKFIALSSRSQLLTRPVSIFDVDNNATADSDVDSDDESFHRRRGFPDPPFDFRKPMFTGEVRSQLAATAILELVRQAPSRCEDGVTILLPIPRVKRMLTKRRNLRRLCNSLGSRSRVVCKLVAEIVTYCLEDSDVNVSDVVSVGLVSDCSYIFCLRAIITLH